MFFNYRRFDYFLILILILSFIPVAIGSSIWYYGDIYRNLSFGIAHSHGFSSIISMLRFGAFGNYRPLSYMMFALGYRLWGINSSGYILFMALCFSISAGFLYLIGKKIKNKLCGLISALVYLAFFPTYSSMWWINNLYDALVLALSTFSIYCLINWADNQKKTYLFWGFFAALLAYLAKASAIFIGPLIFAYGFLMFFRKKKGHCLMMIGFVLSIIFVLELILMRFLPEVWWYEGARWELADIKYNFFYYLQLDLAFVGIGLLLIALLDRPRRLIYPFLTILICIALMIFLIDRTFLLNIRFPAFLGLLVLGFLLGPKEKRFAISWIFIGLISTLQFGWTEYRYQSESSLGLSLLVGLGASAHLANLRNYWFTQQKWSFRLVLKPLTLIGLSLVSLILLFSSFQIARKDFLLSKNEITHLTNYSHNMKEAVEYIANEFKSPARFIAVLNSDYSFAGHALQSALHLYPERYKHDVIFIVSQEELDLIKLNERIIKFPSPPFDFENDYLVASAQLLKEYFVRYSEAGEPKVDTELDYFLEHEFINFASREPLDIKLIKNKNIAVSLSPDPYSIQSQNKDYPGELIYELEGDNPIERLRIIYTYSNPQFAPYRNSLRGLYSLDGNNYQAFFEQESDFSTFHSRWYGGVIISPEIKPKSKTVYLKFEFTGNAQIVSLLRDRPQVIINDEDSAGLREGDKFKLIFSDKQDKKKKTLLLDAKVEKIVGKNGYPVGIVRLKQAED